MWQTKIIEINQKLYLVGWFGLVVKPDGCIPRPGETKLELVDQDEQLDGCPLDKYIDVVSNEEDLPKFPAFLGV